MNGIVRRAVTFALAVGLLLLLLGPVLWALNTALQPSGKLTATPAAYVPLPPTGAHFRSVLGDSLFLRATLNSAIVAGAATALALAVGALAGCALGRERLRGRGAVLAMFLVLTMFPQIAVLGSLFRIVTALDLYNTRLVLVLVYSMGTVPLAVWLLAAFFRELPQELEEAAAIDGAGPFATFWRVLLPLAAPGLVTVAALSFVHAWNEYLFALSFTIDERARTAPVAIATFGGASSYEIPWGRIMAASLLVTAPLIVLALALERRIVAGLTAGATKG